MSVIDDGRMEVWDDVTPCLVINNLPAAYKCKHDGYRFFPQLSTSYPSLSTPSAPATMKFALAPLAAVLFASGALAQFTINTP